MIPLLVALLAICSAVFYSMACPVVAFTTIFLAISIAPLSFRTSVDVFSPYVGLTCLLYLYSLATLIEISGAASDKFSDVSVSIYTIVCLVTQLGYSCAVIVCGQIFKAPSSELTLLRSTVSDAWRKSIAPIAIASLFVAYNRFDPRAITSYADIALSLRVERMDSQSSGVTFFLFSEIPVSFVLIYCVVTVFDERVRFWIKSLACIVLSLFVYVNLLSGWRSSVAFCLIFILIYYNYKVKKIRAISLAMSAALIYVVVNVMPVLRISSDPSVMTAVLYDEVKSNGLGFLAITQSSELQVSGNLLTLIDGIRSGETEYQNGMLAVRQLAAFIPRPMYPARPEMSSEYFAKTFYPKVYEDGGGFGLFLPQDGYWDYGIAGAFVYALAYCAFVESLFGFFRARFTDASMVVLYSFVYFQLVIASTRSGIFASVKTAIMVAVPIMITMVPWKNNRIEKPRDQARI